MTEDKFKQLKVKFDMNKDEKGKSRGENIPKLDKVQGLAFLKYKL
jgi:hypothetical protein